MENIWLIGLFITVGIGLLLVVPLLIIQFFYWIWHWVYDKTCGCVMDKIWPSFRDHIKVDEDSPWVVKCGGYIVILICVSLLWFIAWPVLFVIICLFSLRGFIRFKVKVNKVLSILEDKEII